MRSSIKLIPLVCLPLLAHCSSPKEREAADKHEAEVAAEPTLAAPPVEKRIAAAPVVPPAKTALPNADPQIKQAAPAKTRPEYASLAVLPEDDVRALHADTAPAVGPEDAPVNFVVFTNYECPWCAKLEKRLTALQHDYPQQLRVVWRNLPLPMHEGARPAARAALAASEQGRFKEFSSLLYRNQCSLDEEHFEEFAVEAGLDLARFREALSSGRLGPRLDADKALAKRLGVTGTPMSFINGRRVNGAWPEADLRKLVDSAIAETEGR